jgi:hypothetical protein
MGLEDLRLPFTESDGYYTDRMFKKSIQYHWTIPKDGTCVTARGCACVHNNGRDDVKGELWALVWVHAITHWNAVTFQFTNSIISFN